MQDIFIARQSIYDRKQQVIAYELLYRDNNQNRAQFPDATEATSQVMLNSFMEMGLDTLVGNHRAFINLPQSFFDQIPPIPFSKDQVVLELLEDIEISGQLLNVVRGLKSQGFTLAIDDYLFEDKWTPLLNQVDIIKVEVSSLSTEELRTRIGQLKNRNLRLLAEKIETHEMFDLCKELGFDYFQGYFLSRPKIIHGRKLSDNHMVVLRLLEKLNDPNASVEEVEGLIIQDAGLSFKVLRYINSAAVGIPKRVESIQRAIVLMGLSRIRSWASLITLSGLQDKPSDILSMALTRAMMCEHLLRKSGHDIPEHGFTAGLFSVLDAMLDQPMEEILSHLPLSDEVVEAITLHQGPAGEALACIMAYEHQDWDNIRFPGLDENQIQTIYLDVNYQVIQTTLFERNPES